MRVVGAFLVWFLSMTWTWFKACFRRRWFKTPPEEQVRLDTSTGSEQLRFDEWALSCSKLLKEDSTNLTCELDNDMCTLEVEGYSDGKLITESVSGGETTYREFLARIASSDFVCARRLIIYKKGDEFWKHFGDLSEALLSNTNFRSVLIYCHDTRDDNKTDKQLPGDEIIENCSAIRMSECVSHFLLGNDVIEDLKLWFFVDGAFPPFGKEAAEPLARALCKNRKLRKLELSSVSVTDEGMEVLVKPLKENDSVLETLRFYYVGMTDAGLEHLGVMLCTNTSLKRLWCVPERCDNVYERGFTSLRDALCCNKALEHLTMWNIKSSVELELLLEPLTSMNETTQANTTLTSLQLREGTIGGEEGVKILKRMLQTETSKLLHLTLYNIQDFSSSEFNPNVDEHVVAILEALETNKSLKRITFYECRGIGGHKVLGALMDLLLHNRHLEDIDLEGTTLDYSGDAEYVKTALRKRRNIKLWDVVQGMADVTPQAGRVFLCGNGHAGKTTLRKSITNRTVPRLQNERTGSSLRSIIPSRLKRRNPHKDKFKVSNDEWARDLEISPILERTRGIEVDKLHCNGMDISIWDMAGQTEFHSFHDLVVPNLSADGSCSLYLVVCNPTDQISSKLRNIVDIKSEIKYWLQFIASNTRRSFKYRPHVSFVITHFDIWRLQHESMFTTQIQWVLQNLKEEFQEVLEFDSHQDIFQLDGRYVPDANRVFDFIKQYLGDLMGRLPKTIKACAQVQHLVAQWNIKLSMQAQHVGIEVQPLLQWKEFCNEFCNDLKDLQDDDKELAEKKKEFVAISLHDGGHIMYHEESKFVITNPHWFCHDIMGEFLYRCSKLDSNLQIVSEHGMIFIDNARIILMEIILKKNDCDSSKVDLTKHGDKLKVVEDILSMMEKLHVCYIVLDKKTMIIPSTLKDNVDASTLHWSKSDPSRGEFLYVGRRFICKDVMRTMLSPGFFPRLQVSFFKKFENTNYENNYELFEDVIKFIYDGIEVIIQFSNGHLDILLRCEKSCEDKMLDFLERDIVMHTKELLSSSTLGCPGVILVEHILRPECVEELIDCKDRKDQFVSVEELELAVMTRGFDARHNWKKCARLKIPDDKVEMLVGKRVWHKLLQRRFKELQGYRNEMVSATSNINSLNCREEGDFVETTSTWSIPQRFFGEMRDLALTPVLEELNKLGKGQVVLYRQLDIINRKLDVVLQMQKNIEEMQEKLLCEVSSRINDVIAFSIKTQQSEVPKLAYLTETGRRQIFMQFVPGLMVLQLRLMCESRHKIHEVEHQQGLEVKFGTQETRRIFTVMLWGLNIATILTKIGAHVAGGMGAMVPNFGESIQLAGLILDTSNLLELKNIPNVILESWPDDVKRSPKITREEKSEAQKWLIRMMEPLCTKDRRNFHSHFMLTRVVYKDTRSIAWICDACAQNQESEIDIF